MTIRNAPPGRTPATDSSSSGSSDSIPTVKRVEPIAASAASGGVTSPRASVRGKAEV